MNFDTKISLYKLSLRAICKRIKSGNLETGVITLLPPSVIADALVMVSKQKFYLILSYLYSKGIKIA